MNPLLVITLLAGLSVPGAAGLGPSQVQEADAGDLGAPASVEEAAARTPIGEGQGLLGARANASASAAGLDVQVSTDELYTFMRSRLPGPGFSHQLPDEAHAVGELPVAPGPTDQQESRAIPVPLPSPEEAAVPAGLAVLGAAALAAGWRYVGPWLLAPLYSRIKNDELLENDVRAALMEEIQAEPGLSLQELSERAGSGWGNTVYHLQRLEQAGFVRSEKQGHHRRFYKAGEMDNQDIEALGMLRNETPHKIASYLVQQPGCKQKDVCEALGISASLAHKYLKRMEEQALVTSEREWRSKHYTPDERLARLVEQAA